MAIHNLSPNGGAWDQERGERGQSPAKVAENQKIAAHEGALRAEEEKLWRKVGHDINNLEKLAKEAVASHIEGVSAESLNSVMSRWAQTEPRYVCRPENGAQMLEGLNARLGVNPQPGYPWLREPTMYDLSCIAQALDAEGLLDVRREYEWREKLPDPRGFSVQQAKRHVLGNNPTPDPWDRLDGDNPIQGNVIQF